MIPDVSVGSAKRDARRWDSNAPAQIIPSMLACDFGMIDAEIQVAEQLGLKAIQWDVMDGNFVPNLTYGSGIIASCRPKSQMIFDAHLMIDRPERYVDEFISAGCDSVTLHLEATEKAADTLKRIRDAGRSAGIAIKPNTSVETVVPFLSLVDLVLVMSVEPGFGGQEFLPSALSKLEWLKKNGPAGLLLQVDGGVNVRTAASAVAAGATLLVVGSAFFGAENRAAALSELHKVIHS